MLSSFARAYKREPKIRLRIFGSGPLQADLEKLIQKLNLEEVVELSGWTDDLAGEMRKADSFLLSSNYEGWARVLIESLLQKLPVVTTDVGCVHEVVKGGEHGIVVPVDDEEALAKAIIKMASDKDLYQAFVDKLDVLIGYFLNLILGFKRLVFRNLTLFLHTLRQIIGIPPKISDGYLMLFANLVNHFNEFFATLFG